jgi:hypothetical protein
MHVPGLCTRFENSYFGTARYAHNLNKHYAHNLLTGYKQLRRVSMSNLPLHQGRDDRYGKTERKNLTLTTEAMDAIQAYADRHGLYFSVAIESLALIGLGRTTAETLPRLVTNWLERVVRQQFNRLARLLSAMAIVAGEVNHKADVMLLQTIWREARLDPANFTANMQVSIDLQDQPDGLARQIRDEICLLAHEKALERLKKPLGENDKLWQTEPVDEA